MTIAADSVRFLDDGSSTSAQGFRAGAVRGGIKPSGNLDLGIFASDMVCVAAGTFTQNAFPAAPVLVSRRNVADGRAQAVVFNAGVANACTGDRGLADAEQMAAEAAAVLGIAPDLVLVASTGVVGQFLPMDKIKAGLRQVQLKPDGGHEAAQAIMTTDKVSKEVGVAVEIGGREVRIGGMVKGVGMIHPNMATMLAFLGTDAALEPDYARAALKRVVDRTFNMVTVDGDTSTNDSCFLLANGLAGNTPLRTDSGADAERFEVALEAACTQLARAIARDGEGATKLIEVDVTGAASDADARNAARSIVHSSLVKAAVYGQDPNWGRIFVAVGYSGAQVDPNKAALWIGSLQIAKDGRGLDISKAEGSAQLAGDEVKIHVDLGLGTSAARAWGCDLTEGYVVENSAYTT